MTEISIKTELEGIAIKTEEDIKTEIEESTVVGFELPVINADELESAPEELKEENITFTKTLPEDKKLWKTKKSKKAKKEFACSECPLKYDRPSALAIHTRVHSGERPYLCDEPDCNKTFKVKSRLNAHVKVVHAEEKPHVCSECDKVFLTAHQLAVHFNFHTGEKPYECPHCGKAFTLRGTMSRHIKKHHTSLLTCVKCNKKFPHRQMLNEHINIVHDRTLAMFRCSVCGAEFSSSQSLTRHHKVHEEDCRLLCEFCERPFAHKEPILAHLKAMHMGKDDPYECCFCTDGFASKHKLLAHETGDHGDIMSVCSNCPMTFESISEYRLHSRAHPKFLFTYKCRICKHECTSRDRIAEHINEHKGVTPYECSVCPKKFSHKHLLANHQRSHPEVGRTKKCDVCGKACRHNAELVVHMRLHTGERPFKCDKCPQTFRAEKSLKHHAHVHTDEKAVTCDECGKTFKLKSSLVRHKWTHREVQLHPCQYCPKSFSKRHKWVIHTRIHTGEKPFVCETCGMKFNSKEGLTNHEWTHKGGRKPFNCLVCRKGFMRKAFLKKHECTGPNSNHPPLVDDSLVVPMKVEVNPESLIVAAIDEKIDELTKEPVSEIDICKQAEPLLMDYPPSDTEDYFNDHFSEPPPTVQPPPDFRFKELKIEKLPDPIFEYTGEQFFCETPTCRILFPNFQTLATHCQTAHKMFTHVCKICLRSLQSAEKFDKHFWLEHQVDMKKSEACTLKCALCPATFFGDKEMRWHASAKHKSVKPDLSYFECHDCGHRYSLKVELKKHMNREHRTTKFKADYICVECGRQCRYRAEYIVHLRKHTGEKPYSCTVCGQTFYAEKYLKKHASVHSEEKAFTCDICGKAFKLNSSLIRHKWMHKDQKPHQCVYCEKSFGKRDLWVKHTRIHTGEKPFECEKCGLKFREKDGLKNHQWTHENGKKPYNCPTCKKGFMRKAFLNRHICTGPDWDLVVDKATVEPMPVGPTGFILGM